MDLGALSEDESLGVYMERKELAIVKGAPPVPVQGPKPEAK
jgi:hypothetical protein